MKNENARNTIIFVVLTMAILIAYQVFVLQPQMEARRAAEQARAKAAAAAHLQPGQPGAAAALPTDTLQFKDRSAALEASPRVAIDTPALKGSIALEGARFDDLSLKRYRQTVDKSSPPVELFTPVGARHAYFARFGWAGPTRPAGADLKAVWTLAQGKTLAPGQPVTLTYDAPDGLAFRRTIAVDSNYMFTVTDAVTNNSGRPIALQPYGEVQRQGVPDEVLKSATNVIQGAIQFVAGEQKMFGYKPWLKKKPDELTTHAKSDQPGGWIGITDTYWMAVMAPDQSKPAGGLFQAKTQQGVDVYSAQFDGPQQVIQPGAAATTTTHLFAGAKQTSLIAAYEKLVPIKNFDLTIDWGTRLWPVTRAAYAVLEFFYHHIGDFGVAILLLTVVVKLLLFPLANQAFASMSKMKKLQPKVDELKKQYANDQQKQQQEMMQLYQREKINPLAGCLPVVIQIPIFLALLRVLYLALDMRHAPFLWLKDLSARDPSSIWTLFGLIPWDPATAPLIGGLLDGPLHLGVVAILYGAVMYLQQTMSPASPDPTQQQMMKFMPLIFVFILSRYPVGLMIYWTWSALLSIAQQYFIMHRHKVDNPIDDFIARLRGGGQEIAAGGGG
jgi:YidC/Oxa1 family membrane protein insertase